MVMRPKLVQSNLSEAQARVVLHTVAYPGFENEQSSASAPLPAPTLATLSRLHIHFLLAFPFEALAMNYEPSGSMESTLAHIYSRFIEQRRGGGYCLQVNVLYREMLALLGFRFLGVLGRVYSPVSNDWTGLTHTASLVYLPSHVPEDHGKGVYYLSDVGFGSSPHRPILLRDGWQEFGRGQDKYRLVKSSLQPRSSLEPLPGSPDGAEEDDEVAAVARSQFVWRLQNQKNGKPEWEDCYSFAVSECFYADYQASNKATSHIDSVPFATMILVVRYVLHPDELQHSDERIKHDQLCPDLYPYHPSAIEQRMIVADKHIVKLGDTQTVFNVLQSERQRVELLKSDFGLLRHVSTDDALREIRSKPSALPSEQKAANPTPATNAHANGKMANGSTATVH